VDKDQVAISTPLNVAGMITGHNGLTIEGPSLLEELTAGDTLIQGPNGLTVAPGPTDLQTLYAVDAQLQCKFWNYVNIDRIGSRQALQYLKKSHMHPPTPTHILLTHTQP
jgi:hypothetical protein